MKKLLKTLTIALALLAAPFVVWRLCDDPERRKIEPLVGEWRATGTNGLRLRIYSTEEEYRITVLSPGGPRRGRTYRLRYAFCIHYTDDAGARIDLFYTPAADALLLMPGGKTFIRITESRNHER
jgi:hypothetical protein